MSENDQTNRQPVLWDYPHRDRPERPMYHPLSLWWLVTEVLFILRWYVWHKHRSIRADRGSLEFNLASATRELHFVQDDESIPGRQQERLEAVERSLVAVADELGIESRHIEQFVDEERDSE